MTTGNKLLVIFLSVGGAVFAIILVFVLSSLKPSIKQPSPLPVVTPVPNVKNTLYPTITPLPSLPNQEESAKQQLITLLPVETANYNIEYLAKSDIFVVTIKESPYEDNKTAADQWFLTHGIQDLSHLRIAYDKYKWVD